MGALSVETREAAESVKRIVEQFIPDMVLGFKFLNNLNSVVKKDARGRAHFRPYLVHYRRIVVRSLHDCGFNPAEIANRLRIPIKDVYHDISALRKKQRRKIKP